MLPLLRVYPGPPQCCQLSRATEGLTILPQALIIMFATFDPAPTLHGAGPSLFFMAFAFLYVERPFTALRLHFRSVTSSFI
jgi:hypothetical protein